MTRSHVFGAGTLYVDGQPYAGVRDLRVDLATPPEVGEVPAIWDAGAVTVMFDDRRVRDFMNEVVADQLRAMNAEVLRMLGEWVSGLEPALLLGPHGELIGLTAVGRHDVVVAVRERSCRVCGCTELRACPGRCHWVGADLCSACA
jgi:hypothetical protein